MAKASNTEKLELVPELQQFTVNSFMGIDKSQPVIIDFTKARKNQGFVELSGNQGSGKTSTLRGLVFALCGNVGLDKKKLVNSVDNSISETLDFTYEGGQYRLDVNASRFTLKRKVGSDKWALESSPVDTIKKIFGNVGFFPANIQEMDGRKQIKFFQDMFGSGEDASKKMKTLENSIAEKVEERKFINRDIKTLTGSLEANKLYQNYEKSQELYSKPVTIEKEREKYEAIKKKNDDFLKYKSGLETLKDTKETVEQTIIRLQNELDAAVKERDELEERIEKGDAWVKENETVVEQFKTADAEWIGVAQKANDYKNWQEVLKSEKKLVEMNDNSTNLTAEIDKLRENLLKETKKCLPIEGLSIKVATGIDKTDQEEGVFYNDQPIHQLSESEYADLWCRIWEEQGVPIVVLENITSFGSDFVKTLNQFVKNGGTVFYSMMDRKKDELEISFKAKIE